MNLFLHTGPEATPQEREQLAAGLELTEGRLHGVPLTTGEVITRDRRVVSLRFTAPSRVLSSRGLLPVEQELNGHVYGSAVPADASGATGVPAVWAAGNVTDLRAQVITSATAGLGAGTVINADLIAEDTRRAVEARRTEEPFSATAGEVATDLDPAAWELVVADNRPRQSGGDGHCEGDEVLRAGRR